MALIAGRRWRRPSLRSSRPAAAALVALACVVPAATAGSTAAASPRAPVATSSPLARGYVPYGAERLTVASSLAATGNPHLDYYGGPVVAEPEIVQVLYGAQQADYVSEVAALAMQPASVASFLKDAVAGGHVTDMSEYDTTATNIDAQPGTGQHITTGTYIGRFHINQGTSPGAQITDDDIQAELAAQIGNAVLPDPAVDADGHSKTIYTVFLPAGTRVCDAQACSLTSPGGFCAYHSAFRLHGTGPVVVYTVQPDLSSIPVLHGCGPGTDFQITTSTLSHELLEAITDPLIGLATDIAAPLAWYDNDNSALGEVADICGNVFVQVQMNGTNYQVPGEWSNARDDCFVPGAPVAPGSFIPQPSALTLVAGAKLAVPLRQIGTPTAVTYAATAPTGLTTTFAAASVAAGGTTSVTITAAPTAPSGRRTVTVSTSNGQQRIITVDVKGVGTALDVSAPLVRLLDTRNRGVPVGAGEVVRAAATATGASAVVLNVTATEPTASAFVTVWPCSEAMPLASNLNVVAGQTAANLVTVALGTDADVCVFNSAGRTHIVVDQLSAYRPVAGAVRAGRFVPVTPARALDTRESGAPFTVGESRTIDLRPVGVPIDALAVVLTVTAVDSTAAGFWSVWPSGPWPGTSNLNITRRGQTRANQVVVPASLGTVAVLSQVGGHLVIDVAGFFTGDTASPGLAGLFHPMAPRRAVDTRADLGRRIHDGTLDLGGLTPTNSSAVALNVTVTEPDAAGFVTAFPADASPPLASNVNFEASATVPDHVVVGTGTNRVGFHANVPVHLVIDVNGWYS